VVRVNPGVWGAVRAPHLVYVFLFLFFSFFSFFIIAEYLRGKGYYSAVHAIKSKATVACYTIPTITCVRKYRREFVRRRGGS
jgi:hypothetical protein